MPLPGGCVLHAEEAFQMHEKLKLHYLRCELLELECAN